MAEKIKSKPPIPHEDYIYGDQREWEARLKRLGDKAIGTGTGPMKKNENREARAIVRDTQDKVLGFANSQNDRLNSSPAGLEYTAQTESGVVNAYVDRPDDDNGGMRWAVRVVNNGADRVSTFSVETAHDPTLPGKDGEQNDLDFAIVDPNTGTGYDDWSYDSREDVEQLNISVARAFSTLSQAQQDGTLQVQELR